MGSVKVNINGNVLVDIDEKCAGGYRWEVCRWILMGSVQVDIDGKCAGGYRWEVCRWI